MQEIEVDENKLGIKVIINDKPNLTLIPNEIVDRIMAALELQISEHFNNQEKCNN